MALVKKPTRPRRGDSVKELWTHVDRAIDIVEAHTVEIADLKSRGKRRPLDAGAGGGSQFRGEYLSTATYAVGDLVVIASGANAGTYICVSTNPGSGNPPWVGGGYWVKFFSGNALGQWM